MENFTEVILKEWGMEELISVFNEHGIDEECFHLLDEDTLKELIPRIGTQLRFKQKLSLNRNAVSDASPPTDMTGTSDDTENDNIHVPIESSSTFHSESDCSPVQHSTLLNLSPSSVPSGSKICAHPVSTKFHDFKTFLCSQNGGRSLLADVQKLGFAPTVLRKRLVKIATGFLFEKCGKFPKTEDTEELAIVIITVIPCLRNPKGQGFEEFYQRARGGRPAKGFINDRIYNVHKEEAKLKMVKKRVQLPETVPAEEVLSVAEWQILPEKEYKEMTAWLKHNIEPASKVSDLMAKTATNRHREICENKELKAKDILASFPRLLERGMDVAQWLSEHFLSGVNEEKE
ncbi:uncharacterized protein LOC135498188 [Lineus longissimus]|uniref:uncharacterized protein LOC135498188 n=1 Tax=Lineus longissimus TaxID=88925 RepID=UPI00315D6F8B